MQQISKIVNKVETIFCCFCLAGCVATLFVNAISRACGFPILFANDLAMAFSTYVTFIGADMAYRKNSLARVDLFSKFLPEKYQNILELITLTLCLALFVVLAYLGIQLAQRSWVRPIPSLPNVSYGWIIISVPMGAILMCITTIEKYIALFKKMKSTAEGKEEK